jgi:two-component system chemotaxis response regulator CheY
MSALVATPEELAVFACASAERDTRALPTFLLVEDQLFSVRLMEVALPKPYRLDTAPRAREGWRRYLATAPDVVFLDIEMPEINGHQLAAAIRALDPDAFIVMVTANDYRDDGAKAIRNGAKGFITKPYSKQKVRDCVEKFLNLYPSRYAHPAEA